MSDFTGTADQLLEALVGKGMITEKERSEITLRALDAVMFMEEHAQMMGPDGPSKMSEREKVMGYSIASIAVMKYILNGRKIAEMELDWNS